MTKKDQRGFTLIELNLAMIFVSILLIAAVATSIFAGRLYQKGVALKTVNESGRQLMDQLRRDIASAHTVRAVVAPTANPNYRICTDVVTYVISYADTINSIGGVSPLRYNPPAPSIPGTTNVKVGDVVRVARIKSASTSYCDPNYAWPVANDSTEMLPTSTGSTPIAVHSVSLTQIASMGTNDADRQSLYQLTMVIGTSETGTTSAGNCKPPTDNESNFDYCSVREFSTVIRTRGGE